MKVTRITLLQASIALPHSGKEVKDSVIISFIIGVWLLQLYNLMIIVVNIVICFVGHLFCQVYYKSHFSYSGSSKVHWRCLECVLRVTPLTEGNGCPTCTGMVKSRSNSVRSSLLGQKQLAVVANASYLVLPEQEPVSSAHKSPAPSLF